MKIKHLDAILYRTYKLPISKINSLKDYYSCFNSMNIEYANVEVIHDTILELEWALNNCNFDFNSILKTQYPNDMLVKWFKIYLEHLNLVLELHAKGVYVIDRSRTY